MSHVIHPLVLPHTDKLVFENKRNDYIDEDGANVDDNDNDGQLVWQRFKTQAMSMSHPGTGKLIFDRKYNDADDD